MALDAGVVGADIVHAGRIHSVAASGMLHVLASRTVAAFAADVPLRDLLGVDVVVDRVAAIAGGTGGPLEIVGRIKRRPPVGSIGHEVGPPEAIGNIPLIGFRKVVVSSFGDLTLLPNTAVNPADPAVR